jgi:hypothetical protein
MPLKKTRTAAKHKHNKNKTRSIKNNMYDRFSRPPTPYPFSIVSPISSNGQPMGAITSSSTSMRAVSHDGKNWHVDTDVNGVKKHANVTNLENLENLENFENPKNLTNSQIMEILAYPAAKQDLKTRLLEEFRNIRQPLMPMLAQQFGEPQIQYKYIYKNGCANKPVMINNLSPLHEAKIVPDSSSEPIHLVDVSLGLGKGAKRSIKPLKKGRAHTKGKKYHKPRK